MLQLTLELARSAAYGGLVFGAGGGGLERGLRAAERTFEMGRPRLATLDEFDDGDWVVVTTGVGAPGVHRQLTFPWHAMRAVDLLLANWKNPNGGRVVGAMGGHPGAFMAGGWLISALRPDFVQIDCATNGRGHPTVMMGGMGLAGRSDVPILQVAAGGLEEEEGYLEVTARGSMAMTGKLLHEASAHVGASIAAARGPFSVAFCKQYGAVGAVSACIKLGEAMRAAEGHGADAMINAIVETLGGRILGSGPIARHHLQLEEAWDVGSVAVALGDRSELGVTIVNEYMAAEIDGGRVASFPDLIVTLSATDGMPTSAAGMRPGDQIVVIAVDRARIPIGAGVYDRTVYAEAERLTGKDFATYALAQQSIVANGANSRVEAVT